MKAIACCACGSVPKYCESSFKAQFPGEPMPKLYIKNKATDILDTLPLQSKMHQELAKILKKRGRYGFYFEYTEDGEILDYWNLLKHRRVA